MKKTIIRAENRGFSNHGWLKTYHVFSFGNYYDETRMSFGNLRVLNDDYVEPEGRFGPHSHDNIEIISIPLEGAIAHKDIQGNEHLLKKGDVQVLTAGKGLTHTEYNPSSYEPLNFIQLWILPNQFDVEPSYQNRHFEFKKDKLIPIIRPDGLYSSLVVMQEVHLYYGRFSAKTASRYFPAEKKNGIFLFMIEGKIKAEGEEMHKRDSIGFVSLPEIELNAIEEAEFILLEVPLEKATF